MLPISYPPPFIPHRTLRDDTKTHPPAISLCLPEIIFLASAISFFIYGAASILAIIFGNTNIIRPLASIMSTIGFLSMARMLTPVLTV